MLALELLLLQQLLPELGLAIVVLEPQAPVAEGHPEVAPMLVEP